MIVIVEIVIEDGMVNVVCSQKMLQRSWAFLWCRFHIVNLNWREVNAARPLIVIDEPVDNRYIG